MSRGHFLHGDATALPFDGDTFDLTFTSPPYLDARTYGIGAQRNCVQWVDWMLGVVKEACRVTKGLVIVNCAGVTRDWRYQPGPEGLLWRWWERGGECWRPAIWHRVGIPGSGGKQWLRADTEYLLAFKRNPGKIPWADNLACGHPPKWGPGGEMSYRNSVGTRRNQWGKAGASGVRTADGLRDDRPRPSHVNQWGHSINSGATVTDGDFVRSKGRRPSHTTDHDVIDHPFGNPASTAGRRADGEAKPIYMNGKQAGIPVLANPGNVVKVIVGGGVMGHPLAHENEAPFPEALAEFFIKSFCPPGGRVLDPFSGSGTTVCTAVRLGRDGVGVDLRESQVKLGRRRLNEPVPQRKKKTTTAKGDDGLFAGLGAA